MRSEKINFLFTKLYRLVYYCDISIVANVKWRYCCSNSANGIERRPLKVEFIAIRCDSERSQHSLAQKTVAQLWWQKHTLVNKVARISETTQHSRDCLHIFHELLLLTTANADCILAANQVLRTSKHLCLLLSRNFVTSFYWSIPIRSTFSFFFFDVIWHWISHLMYRFQ